MSSPCSSSPDRLSMYSSRGCSPSLNNLSVSKLMHGIELPVDESDYHDLINLRNNNKVVENKNKTKRVNPNTKFTFTYSFDDSMPQELTESNANDCIHYKERDGEKNEQLKENERPKETHNEEAEREEGTESAEVEDVERERDGETDNTDEEQKSSASDTISDYESDDYSISEVVSDVDNDDLEEEGEVQDIQEVQEVDAQNNDVADEWNPITDLTPELEECTLNESTLNIPIEDISPAGIFSLFVTDEIIKNMVTETNKYASKYIAAKQTNNEIKRKSRLLSWKDTNDMEMRSFMGILLAMGLNKVPHMNDYWSKKSLYQNEYIASIMNRDRFLILFKFWHFTDDSTAIQNTKLNKIYQLANMLNMRFQEILTPGKFVVIDESMIPWRGRLSFKQYIKNKSHKYGVKIYKLCTPEGYTYNSIIYSGKGVNGRENNHGKVTVLKLMQGLENKSREVIADNFYSSIELAEELLSLKTLYCGTLRSNRRGLPKSIVSLKLKKGEIKGAMNKNGVKCIKWADKRQILMLSTRKEDKDVLVNTGKKNRKTNEDIMKPTCVLTYNNNKKGVDFSDQMSSYYSTLKRGLKWFRKVAMEYLFGMALVNAWIIYNMKHDKVSKKEFTEALLESLTGKKICPRSRYNHYNVGICWSLLKATAFPC